MTVEDLHDAITLLPVDLVAEADKRRGRKPYVVIWHRWAAMAACLTLILGCGFLIRDWRQDQAKSAQGMMAAPAAAAPEEAPMVQEAAMDTQERCKNTESVAGAAGDSGSFAPGVLDIAWVETPVDSTAAYSLSGEPKVFLLENREMLEDYLENRDALLESTGAFDTQWFAAHDLLLIRLDCPAGTAITDIREREGRWEIYLSEPSPESSATGYHILITMEKNRIASAEDVTVYSPLP